MKQFKLKGNIMNIKKMINKNWEKNVLYLLIALIAFSFSLFKWNSQIWIAAWIAPVFLLRFTRNNKWASSVIFGFLVLLISYLIGFLPAFASFNLDSDIKNTIISPTIDHS